MEKNDEINLQSFGLFVKRKLPMILIVTIIGLCAGIANAWCASRAAGSFSSSAKVLMDGAKTTTGLTDTYKEIISSNDFKKSVADKLGDINAEDIDLSITSALDTSVFTITAASSSEDSERIANEAADRFVDYANSMNLTPNLTDKKDGRVVFKVLDRASDTTLSVAVFEKKTVVIYTLAGLAIAFAIVIFEYLIDDRIRSRADIKNANIYGTVHLYGKYSEDDAEILAAKVSTSLEGEKVIVVMAPNEDIAAPLSKKLAYAYSRIGKKVVLVDADYRTLDVNAASNKAHQDDAGFADALKDPKKVLSLVRTDAESEDGVDHFLPRGHFADNEIGAQLQSESTAKVIDKLAEGFDIVIVSAGHVLGHADALALAQNANVNILAVSANHTKGRHFEQAVAALAQVGVDPDGVVIVKH